MSRLLIIVSTLLAFYVVINHVQARPEQIRTGETASTESAPVDDNQDSTSEEDSSSHQIEDGEIHVKSKAANMCPMRHHGIIEVEEQCAMEYKTMVKERCNSTGLVERMKEHVKEKVEEAIETAKEMVQHAKKAMGLGNDMMNATENIAINMTHNAQHHNPSCNYYQCILKKLDVLDKMDKLDEGLLLAWINRNITDGAEKASLQQTLTMCFSELREEALVSDTMEMDTSAEKEENQSKEMVNPDEMKCRTHQKLFECLTKNKQCPTFKYP